MPGHADVRSNSEFGDLEKYLDIFLNFNAIIIIHDFKGKILKVNKKFLNTLGYSDSDISSLTVKDLLPKESQKICRKIIDDTLSQGSANHEVTIKKKNQDTFPAYVYTSILEIGDTKLMQCVLHDITERKNVETELKNSHDELEQTIRERTSDLSKVNEQLRTEAGVRKKAEEVLQTNLEQLSRKNRYLKIISTVSRSVHQSIELDQVFENAVEALSKNIDNADHVAIYMVEDDLAVLKSHRGYPKWFHTKVAKIPKSKGVTWETLTEGKPRYCSDVDKDTSIGPAGRKIGTKSYASMPIKYQNITIGCINIHSRTLNTFDEEEIKLLQIVANQIETAINNANQAEALKNSEESLKRNVETLSKKSRYEEIISTVTRIVHQSLNLNEVLENAVDAMNKNVDHADNVSIYLVQGDTAVLKSHTGYPKWFTDRVSNIPKPKGFTWKTLTDGLPRFVSDASKDKHIGPAGRKVGTKSYASMPIKHNDTTIGCININSRTLNAFDDEEINLLEIIATQIETAINNANQAEALKCSREDLIESEEHYRLLVETTDVIPWEVDAKTFKFTYVGPQAEKLLGYPIQKWYKEGFWSSHLHEGDRDRTVKACISATTALKNHELEYRMVTEKGDIRWIYDMTSVIAENGEAKTLRGFMIDITERKKTEQALQTNLEQLSKKSRYEEIISTVTTAVHQSIDVDEVIENAIEAMSGKIENLDISAIYMVEGQEAVLKTHRGHSKEFIKRAGRIPYPKGVTWKTIIEGKSKYIPDVDKDKALGEAGRKAGMKSYLATPLCSEGKGVGAIFMISYKVNAFDEVELKLLEIISHQIETAINNASHAKALGASEQRYKTLFTQSPVGVCTIDKDLKITQCNEHLIKIFRSSREKIIGLDLNKLKDKSFVPFVEKAFTGQTCSQETSYEATTSGAKLWLAVRTVPLKDSSGNIISVMGVVEDITERKKAEEALNINLEQLSKKNRYEEIISTVTTAVHQSIDLRTVLDNSIEAMRKNIENLDIVSIYLVEGDEAVLKAHHGFTRDYLKRAGRIQYPKGATWKTIIEGKSIYVPDIELDKTLGPAGRDMGVKCFLTVPLFIDKKAVGCIGMVSYEKNVFDEEELKLLEIVSKQISVAIRNANQAETLKKSEESLKRNVEILSKKNRYEQILNSVTRNVHKSEDLQEVLENAVDAINRNINVVDHISIFLVEDEDTVMKAHRGYPDWFLKKVERVQCPKGVTWSCFHDGKAILCPDGVSDCALSAAGKKIGTKSYIAIQLKDRGETIGCINVHSLRKNAFQEDDIRLLESLGKQIEIAVSKSKNTEALRESEEHYRLLVETANVIPWEADANTFQCTYIGPRIEKLLGYPVQKWYEDEFWQSLIHEDDRDRTVKANILSTAALKDFELEYKMVTKKGDVRWIHDMVSVVVKNGEAKTLRGFMMDITERKHAEEVLLKTQQGLSEAQRIAHLGNWDWNIQTNELLWSDEVYRIFGVKPQEFGATYDAFLSSVHPDDREFVKKSVDEAVYKRKNYNIDHRIVLPDGSERIVHEQGEVRFEDHGKPIHMIGTIHDITERKKAEIEKREAEERHRTLVEHSYDIIAETSDAGKFLYVNPTFEELLGYKSEEVLNTIIFDYVHEEDKRIVKVKFKKALRKFSGEDGEYRFRHKDGSWRWLESIGSPFQTAAGEIRAAISSRDITERKRAEEDLKNAFSEIELLKDRLEKENIYLKKEIELTYNHANIIGTSNAIKLALNKIEQVAGTDSTVLLTGETGTGKERFADRIHNLSRHSGRTMVKVNCAALPPHLIESELFGHEKGAFTGAVSKSMGRFEMADDSTIFLDEVGELPLELQSKLLRVLQEGEFQRVGSSNTTKVNVRVIAASNNDLLDAVNAGKFRDDLYYRLNVFPINIPPLRERKEDITDLLWFFISEFEEKMGKTIKNISRKDMENLINYPWPGNIRQLRNIIERAMIISSGPDLEIEMPGISSERAPSEIKEMDEVERNHISHILNLTDWRIRGKAGAAEILGLKPTTLESRIKKLAIVRGH